MPSINSMASSADLQSGPIKNGAPLDASSARVTAPDKANAASGSTLSADDASPHKMFDRVLSDATPTKAPDSKTAAAKTKADAGDQDAAPKSEQTAPPNINLLMSLLPALAQTPSAPATTTPSAALAPQDAASATAPVSAAPTNSAAAITAATNNATAQTPLPGTLKTTDMTTAASALPTAVIAAVSSAIEGKSIDKADSFGTVLANIEAAISAPFIAGPAPQAAIATTTAVALAATIPSAVSDLPVTHNEWPAALGHQLLWTIGEGLQKAEISVTPQDMGPINVHIRIENDKADIRFTATHAVTRDALESSIPRLREMFSQQGLNLSQAQVFSQTPQDGKGRHPDSNPANPGAFSSDSAEPREPEKPPPRVWRRGLVDDYA